LRMAALMRENYRGTLMLAGGYDRDTAEAWLREGRADLIAFGRKYIANPTCRNAFVSTPLSLPMTRLPIMAAGTRATRTTRPLHRSAANIQSRASTKTGDKTALK